MAGSRLSVSTGTCTHNIIIISVALVFGSSNEAVVEGWGFGSRRKTVEVASMMEVATASSCSTTGYGNGASMLVHRNGPCSKDPRSMDHGEMMTRDSLMVKWLGMKSGVLIGTAEYMVTVELGTPGTMLQFVLDTGSGFTWTQSKGCTKCYIQVDPLIHPSP
ncbi:hypothetical protein MLD38_006380 [Melastoma candidum]|uniref:Uncharacterized protein n=1 Tax=Melastoma candidum TaxID=119954 RepID=A0ACB9RMQ6_9MYRT|nr:hypothetical protein MLD38_006380 [Melastoma candidum]